MNAQLFKNQIIHVAESDLTKIKNTCMSSGNIFIAEINGASIHSWHEYSNLISQLFKFPASYVHNMNSYLDWMCDLGWLNKAGYVLIIYNYSQFLIKDPESKNKIMKMFSEVILPFWQEEVSRVVVEGKPKPFMVYLVN